MGSGNGGFASENPLSALGCFLATVCVLTLLNFPTSVSLSQLKKQTKAKTPVFDWAIGWLSWENKVPFTQQQRSIRVRLI